MKPLAFLALGFALLGTAANAADYKTLRRLAAPTPIQLEPLPAGAKPRATQFAKVVIHPADGQAWALAYESIVLRSEGGPAPVDELLTWDSGRMDAQTAAFERAYDDELRKAGFQAGGGGSSLFDDSSGAADLKVGVLIDDIKGRFCLDCPNLFNRKAAPATVVMTAHWEVYSSLDRKVVARVTTTGGFDSMGKVQGSVVPAVLGAFRENVRRLMATPEFRSVVLSSTGAVASPASEAPLTPIALGRGPGATASVAQAVNSVAVVYAADGSGSGFLVSGEGYVLTNQHVVGGSKYVKLRWPDGSETLGEVIRANPRRDVALIKTDAKGRAPLALRLGGSQPGDTVFAVGTPLQEKFQNSLTKGIVSALRSFEGQPFIQSDVAINHGNSGGPLLDEGGRVIGLTVSGMMINEAQVGINLFIPIEDALKALAIQPAG